ncbi:MAG: HAD family hydrolase [Hungatella hathewayi]|nr:HAD family hydrolase [Hungatella hathewayi]
MNDKQYLLFDLDGTLTDPMVGITKSVQYALRHYGIEEPDLKKLCPFIGPPLKDSFMKYYGFPSEQATEAISIYREYFSKTGLYENMEYPGIRDLLATLKAAGKHLYVATSKPELFSKQILEHFRLAEYFDFIGGANMDETRVKKGDVIRYVLEENQIAELDKVVMIGDREHDIIGAKENSIDSIGVLYGYGDREELSAAGADVIVETIRELGEVFE